MFVPSRSLLSAVLDREGALLSGSEQAARGSEVIDPTNAAVIDGYVDRAKSASAHACSPTISSRDRRQGEAVPGAIRPHFCRALGGLVGQRTCACQQLLFSGPPSEPAHPRATVARC
jgi:hypothetical protein